MAYRIPGSLPEANAAKPFVYDHKASMARWEKETAERPAREKALTDMIREFTNAYGTAALKPIVTEATSGGVYWPSIADDPFYAKR